MKRQAWCLCFLLLVVGCDQPRDHAIEGTSRSQKEVKEEGGEASLEVLGQRGPYLSDFQALTEGQNRFAWDLYELLKEERSHFVFSPYGVLSGLQMVCLGARDQTWEEIRRAFYWPYDRVRFVSSYLSLHHMIDLKEFKTSNVLWIPSNDSITPLYSQFLSQLSSNFVKKVNFEKNSEAFEQQMSWWMHQETNGRFEEAFSTPFLRAPHKGSIITNFSYLSLLWAAPFSREATLTASFFLNGKKQLQLPFMRQSLNVMVTEEKDFTLLELPCSTEVSLWILLPNSVSGLQDVEATLKALDFRSLHKKAKEQLVEIYLPRFVYMKQQELKTSLMSLGMKRLFSEEEANFSGINEKGHFFLNQLIQSTCMELSEEGIEVSLDEIDLIDEGRGFYESSAPKIFRADHPFLFLIVHKKSADILFIGRITMEKN